MKKFPLLLLLASVLVIVVWLVLRPSAKAPVRASDLVSADTDILIVLPDLKGARERFTGSALGRMLRDRSVSSFLRRPLSRLAEDESYAGARRELAALGLRNLLVAVECADAEQVHVLVAFRASGGEEKTEAALRRLLEEIVRAAETDGVIEESEEGDFRLRTLAVDGQTLQTAVGEGWGAFSNAPAQLQGFLQRVEGREAGLALASAPEYAEVRGAMPDSGDLKIFVRPNRLVEWLVEFSAAQGETLQMAQLAPIAQLRSFGMTIGFEGDDTVERMAFFGGPDLPGAALSNPALPFAPANALLYASNRLNLTPETVGQMMASLPPDAQVMLNSLAVPPAEWPELFGDEAGLFVSWPAASLFPAAMVVAKMKDAARMEKLATQAGGMMAGEAIVSRENDMTVMTWSTGGLNLLAPTLGLRGDLMFLSLAPGDLARALETEKSGDGFATTALWKDSAGFFRKANQQVSVLDLPGLVGRLYTSIQPMLGFAAAMSPDLQRTVDLQLLPAPEDLNQFLGAVRMMQSTQGDGLLSETRGPVTWGSVLLGMSAGLADGFSFLHEEQGGAGE